MGMADYDKTPFAELGKQITQPIGCANCHEANTMKLIVTNPALEEALKAQGKDWRTFTRQEMRTVVCANCHVEYYFKGDGKYLTFPWANGTKIENIADYYAELGFKDWEHPQIQDAHDQDAASRVRVLHCRQHPLQGRRCLRRLPHALHARWRRQVLQPRCAQPAA